MKLRGPCDPSRESLQRDSRLSRAGEVNTLRAEVAYLKGLSRDGVVLERDRSLSLGLESARCVCFPPLGVLSERDPRAGEAGEGETSCDAARFVPFKRAAVFSESHSALPYVARARLAD